MKHKKNQAVKIFQEMQNSNFNLSDPFDRKIIKDFENELLTKYNRVVEVAGNALSGYSLYLHENNLFIYSEKNPGGAVVMGNLDAYKYARKKKIGLDDLWYQRELAKRSKQTVIN